MALISLCQVEDVKHLLLGKQQDDDDSRITSLIRVVSQQIAEYLDRDILSETDKVELFDVSPGSRYFRLRGIPVTSLVGIWNDTSRVFGSGTEVSADSYYFDTARGTFQFDFPVLLLGYGVLKVQYNGGMAASTNEFVNTFPALAGACATEVAYRYQRGPQVGLVTSSVEGSSYTVGTKQLFLPEVEDAISPFKRY